jgi:O-antigen chain-terminating methyltransferase
VLDRLERLEADLCVQRRRIGLFLNEVEKTSSERLHERARTLDTADQADDYDRLYAAFEERFRGSREEIKDRLKVYLPLLREANLGRQDMPILDLACGRGEWLELLQDNALHAHGVDVNRVFLDQCRRLGLVVTEGDLFCHLRSVPDASVGGVSGFHIVEHLTLPQLLRLFDEALRVLKHPENIVVGACNFYADPTHQRPLYPATLQFLATARGFSRVDILRVNQHVLGCTPLAEGPPAQWGWLFEYVKRHFLAAPDYAVIARRA